MERLVIPKFIAFRKILGKLIILNLKDRRFHIINGGGVEILDLIDKGAGNASEIIHNLCKKYTGYEDVIKKEVPEFLEKCIKLGILKNKMKGGESYDVGHSNNMGRSRRNRT